MTYIHDETAEGLTAARLSALLARAQDLIRADDLQAAAAIYRTILADPSIAHWPNAQTDALDTLGALILHEVRTHPRSTTTERQLEEAIFMLGEASASQDNAPRRPGDAVTHTNLALALLQRYRFKGREADLLAAYMHLDTAQAIAANADDQTTLDWIGSARETLATERDRRAV